ncbi:DUF308 domain-containing protein [Methanoregula sp.]|uniref:DUF308 domain-containing protein n=1 Tax=Methanoregula sp. TaxID=2052170 RepID=UPI003D0FDE8F
MRIRNNNKYMNNPSLVFCDMPVRWWQISVIGIIIFISGIDAFFWTPTFIGLLIPIFGLLALSVGAIMIAFSLSMKEELVHQFPVFFAGALSLIIAVVVLLLPGFIEPSFIIIMAFLAIINSVLLIFVGCSLSEEWKTRLVIVLFGMLTLFLSILMALFPELSSATLVKIWGVYAWVIGVLCVIAGVSMKLVEPASTLVRNKPAVP